MDREYRRALEEKKIADEKKARDWCPGCTNHGNCDVAEMAGLAPGEHFWFIENECDLCGIRRTP